MLVTPCWTKSSSSDSLFLWGKQNQTRCSRCCLPSATQMAIITFFDPQSALFLMWLIFTSTRTHRSLLLNLLVQQEPRSFFTKLLLSLLSQVLNFVELRLLPGHFFNWNSNELFLPSVVTCKLERAFQPIPQAVNKNTVGYHSIFFATDCCGTPLVNWPPVIVNSDSELLTLPFSPKGPASFSPSHL